jgi:hypothetical protein
MAPRGMTLIRTLTTLALALALAGCGQGEGVTPSSPAKSAAATAAPTVGPATRPPATALPTVALGPRVTLALESAGPIVEATDGPAGHPYALPAAAARDGNGGYLLYIVWFGPDPGDQLVTLARSDDGRAWRIGRAALFTDLGMTLANPGPIPATVHREADGTWRMFGWAARATDSRRFSSWRASAPAPEGPWVLDAQEVLAPGPAGAWDSQTAAVAEVHATPDGYAMWYEGQGPGNGIRGDIGFATSVDGLAWTKFDDPATTDTALAASDPVMRRGMCGPGSALAIYQPQVEVTAGGYLAVVGAWAAGRETMDLFGATSAEGREWRCGSETPILRAEDIPGSQGIHTIASMPLEDGRVGLLLESLGDAHSDLWLAIVEVAP